MKILGVDPGSRFTGFGVLVQKDKKLSYVASGCIRPPSSKTFPERLQFIYNAILEIIKEHSPDMLALEDVFVAKDPRAALKLGQVRGAIMVAAGNFNVKVIEYPPAKVKQALVGNGRAEKCQVSKMVQLILKINEPEFEDETDALAAAICHGHSIGGLYDSNANR